MNEVLQGNCIEVMRDFDDQYFDLCLTDPPYNAANIGPNARTYAEGTMKLPIEEYKQFCHDWFTEARRVSRNMLFTPGIANVCYYPQPDWMICWHKPSAVSFNRMGGFNAWEPILFYGKMPKGKRLGQDYILRDVQNFKRGLHQDHPCPKPLELMRMLVDKFSLEGEKILEPFAGSGTTLVAAEQLGRHYIGIETVPQYVELCRKRLSDTTQTLFQV